MRASLFLFCLLWLSPLLQAGEEPVASPQIGLVTGDRVNLRAAPSNSCEILLQFSKGTHIQIVTRKGDWYGIPLPSHASVFVSKAFLQLENGKARVQGDQVHIRAGPGQAFTILGTLNRSQEVQVRQIRGEWVEIQPVASCLGWVSEKFVTLLEPVSGKDSS